MSFWYKQLFGKTSNNFEADKLCDSYMGQTLGYATTLWQDVPPKSQQYY